MTIIEKIAYPRAGLLGNPSDGYFGKTIAFTFRDFQASVRLEEAERLQFIPNPEGDRTEFNSRSDFTNHIDSRGYYGGLRLLKAAVRRFLNYCRTQDIELPNRYCAISYESNIPRRVGLACSSAIITATLRGLCEFYNVSIPKPLMANLTLEAESNELGIPAGLQDRVVQVYEGFISMDFNRELMTRQGYGQYTQLDIEILPNIYIAWDEALEEGTEVAHTDVRRRWLDGDQTVIDSMNQIAELVGDGLAALKDNDTNRLGELINRNFDLRSQIYNISLGNQCLIAAARRAGVSAKFAGSGGAIVGTFENDAMFEALRVEMEGIGASILRPALT